MLLPQFDQDVVEGYQPPANTRSRDMSPVFDVGYVGGMWAGIREERKGFRHRREGGG